MEGTLQRRIRAVVLPVALPVAVVVAGLASGCGGAASTSRAWSGDRSAAASSHTLVAAVRTEPRSFNRLVARDATTDVITRLTQASLVTIDRTNGRLEPDLVASWHLLSDGVTYALTLRDGLRFSDGQPFTAADVVFTFEALYDEHGGTALADTVRVAGQPLAVRALDDRTVHVTFPAPFGPGLRLLDGVPMLPRHRLAEALSDGRFAQAWGPATPPADVVGLGPYALEMARSGQGLRFGRNRYYAGGAPPDGPDSIVLKVVSDPETELALLESGELDLTPAELRPSDYGALTRRSGPAPVTVHELGVALDGDLFWLNLSPTHRDDPRSRWLQHPAFRTALALAIDRSAFVDHVYLGAAQPACGLVSPGNREWVSDPPPCRYDAAAARRQLTALGLADADADGTLDAGAAGPVRFTLLTQRGNVSLERGAGFIADSLRQIGVVVDVVPLDPSTLVDRISSDNYDAAYFRLLTSDSDPALNADFWRSSGSAHVWNPGQRSPATDWERRIDALMDDVEGSADSTRRHDAFRQVQAILNRERPVEVFAFPRLWIATSHRIARIEPALFRPFVLWKPQAIEMRHVR